MGIRGFVDRNSTSEVTSSADITDHAVVRGDGGGKGIQGSSVLIDDSDNMTGVNSLSLTTPLTVANGGTGAATFTDNALLRGQVTGALDPTSVLVSDNGEMTNGSQPAFLAYLGTSDSNATGNNTTYTLGSGNALTEVFDQNNDFNTNGTFTAPVTGRYKLGFYIKIDSSTGATSSTYTVTTSNRTYTRLENISSLAVHTFYLEVLADMDASDTATFTVALDGIGADTADIDGTATRNACFGYLVC